MTGCCCRARRRFERLVPGSELRWLPGAGHVPMAEAPDELAELILAFAAGRGND